MNRELRIDKLVRLKMEESRSQREKERERRRIRDRERRSSMTIEQRERHLARRRRNYQIRRLRSRNIRTTNPLFEQQSFSSSTEMAEINSHPAQTSIAELDLQRNGLTLVGFNHHHDALNPDSIRSSGSETLDPKTAILEGRVRLSHIRRVARSIIHKSSSEQIGIHQLFSQVEESTCKCNSLRLNRVKHLARMMNSSDSQHQTTISG